MFKFIFIRIYDGKRVKIIIKAEAIYLAQIIRFDANKAFRSKILIMVIHAPSLEIRICLVCFFKDKFFDLPYIF